ncbi:hypothetical protein ACWD4P_25325 [Kitasatospora sp. NPDC002543]
MNAVNKELRWVAYDTDWSKDLEIPLAFSPFAPAVEAYKGLLYCLHQDTVSNPELWWDVRDKDTEQWRGDQAVVDVAGNRLPCYGAPAVTHANDFLYCVHHRAQGDTRLWWTRYNTEGSEAGWSAQQPVKDDRGDEVRSTNPAAVTVYDGLLYCVHDDNGSLRWITYDTAKEAWSIDQPVPGGIQTARAPAVDRFKDHLYCVHDRGGDDLYCITYDSKTREWGTDQPMVDGSGKPIRTSYAPAVTRYNDYLYCVFYVGEDTGGQLWWTRYNVGGPWSTPKRIPYVISSPGADITAYEGPLYCAHRG